VRDLFRVGGRIALWVCVGLLLVRGIGAVLSAPRDGSADQISGRSTAEVGLSVTAFAVRFARTYIDDPSPQALAPFLAEGAAVPAGGRVPAASDRAAQAEVAGVEALGRGGSLVTVAVELLGGGVRYLAVPITRASAGEVTALGAPSLVAVPAAVGVDAERLQPLAGAEAGAIEALISRFLPVYLSATNSGELSYLLASGVEVAPLGGALRMVGAPSISQLGSDEGPTREVLASVRVTEEGGGVYPATYRLRLVRRERWYVAAVEGAAR
jgi:hypothetical protein